MNLADVVGYFGNIPVDRSTIPLLIPDIAAYKIIERHGLDRTRYITVHDGFDTSYIPLGDTVTKCWPRAHWKRFVAAVKASFPNIMIVQLGAGNSQRIEGVDLDLRNGTTLDEVCWILKHSLLHVDGEKKKQFAHALHTRSVVLFGPTTKSYFALDGNINLAPGVCGDSLLVNNRLAKPLSSRTYVPNAWTRSGRKPSSRRLEIMSNPCARIATAVISISMGTEN